MKVSTCHIEGLKILEPEVFGDGRGFFFESFNARRYADEAGIDDAFVQDNHSRSQRGVLRGLHYQRDNAQGKLVRVTAGRVFDVAVDLRRRSPSFGQWYGLILSADDHRQFWIPAGFAHGFLVLSESADFLYKTTGYYSPGDEHCLIWNDATVGIEWPLDGTPPTLSERDGRGRKLEDVPHFP